MTKFSTFNFIKQLPKKTFAQLFILELIRLIRVLLNKRLKQMYTAISRKVIEKTVHATIPRKVINRSNKMHMKLVHFQKQ